MDATKKNFAESNPATIPNIEKYTVAIKGTDGKTRNVTAYRQQRLENQAFQQPLIEKNRENERIRQEQAAQAEQARQKEKNYRNYYRLHTGEAAGQIPNAKLPDYVAKAAIAAMMQAREMSGENVTFRLSEARKQAEKLQKGVNFRAALKAAGPDKVREVLRSGDVAKLTDLIEVKPRRYALNPQAADDLNRLGETMHTEGRSEEWKALKKALTDPEARSSAGVFDAVEQYLKGKKSVRKTLEGQKSVEIALSALAIAAGSGDAAAKARARLLTDRINEVRGTSRGDKNFVDLADYPKEELLMANGPRIIETEDVILDDTNWQNGDPYEKRDPNTAANQTPDKMTLSRGVEAPKPIEIEDILLDEGPTY